VPVLSNIRVKISLTWKVGEKRNLNGWSWLNFKIDV
jgi:hypothetical protein